jgi:hypothetical protein
VRTGPHHLTEVNAMTSPAPPPSLLLDPDDAGRVLYATRPTAGPLAWLVLVALLTGAAVVGAVTPEGGLGSAIGTTLGATTILGGLFALGRLDHHRVCEHALVLGLNPWPGGQPYVIPWTAVDPHSLALHRPANRPGRPAAEMGSRGARMAVYSTRAVSVLGLHPDLAHPKRRHSPLSLAREMLGTRTPQQLADDPPMIRWVMGTRHPEPLLRAIEDALSRHRDDAAGIADAALAEPMAGGHPPPGA